MQEYIRKIIESNRRYIDDGVLPEYIPELKKAKKDALGMSVVTLSGEEFHGGDSQYKFTIQSISKVISLLLALEEKGEDYVFSRVGMEPTGDPFNSMVKLETVMPSKPFNPMINAGAIAISSMLEGRSSMGKVENMLAFYRQITDNPDLTINENVYLSEKRTGDRNRALAYFMKDVGVIDKDVEGSLDVYFKQCSIEVTTKDIARIGAFLANDGVDLITGETLIEKKYIKIAKTFMFTCGMYNASGEFAINVGIPAKSGVGGGILATVPGKMGIGVVGPSLDEKGNSVAGVRLIKDFSKKYKLSIF
jgi:glutaminase